jgi:hypothetical protein
MTNSNEEICICGHEEEIHIKGKNSDGSCKAIIGYDNDGEEIFCSCQKFTPRIEKTEVQTICPLGETIPDFTQEIEKFKENNQHKINNDEGDSCLSASADRKQEEVKTSKDRFNGTSCFSTSDENCEICKDYPKEYWCGNPENKVSTPDEEIINEIKKRAREYLVEYKDHGKPFQVYEKLFTLEDIKQVLSLKEQEVSKTVDYWENELKKCEKFWTEKYQTASDNWKHWYDENKKNKECLSSLQEKIERIEPNVRRYCAERIFDGMQGKDKISVDDILTKLRSEVEELQKIFQEMGE